MFRVFSSVSIKVTKDCFQHVAAVCQENQALRVMVEPGTGCGGFSYKFEITGEFREDDLVFKDFGAAVVVDSESARLMDGAEVDYTKSMIRRAFVVKNNPLAEMTCGCGTSFAPKAGK